LEKAEKQGVEPRRLGWEAEMNRERLAREIKQKLLCSDPAPNELVDRVAAGESNWGVN
jgi:hypothetical protein